MVTEAEDAGGSVCIVMRSLWNLDKNTGGGKQFIQKYVGGIIYIYLFIYLFNYIYLFYVFIYRVCVSVYKMIIDVYLVGVHIQYIIYTLLELQRL